MSASGEADDTDALGVDVPFGGVGADGLDGALCVGEWNEGVALGESVLQDDADDPVLVEPFGNAMTFCAGHEAAVSTAGADY